MIQLESVSKSFRVAPGPGRTAGTIHAVREITATIEPGLITGVVGPNGAGKTTLFGLLLGFLEPTDGMITINELDPRAYVRKHGATYLPERFQLPRDWTVGAGLQALLALDSSNASAEDTLARYDLSQYAKAKAHTLSRGTMQRLGMAQAFAMPRSLVVLDEPTEGLDPLWRVRLREEMLALRAPDRVVLIASHDLSEVERVADRVLVLREGGIVESIDLREQRTGVREFMLVLTAASDKVDVVFSTVRRETDSTYVVTVQDNADLSARLAALIETGASVVSVNPTADLEQRVTRAARQEPG